MLCAVTIVNGVPPFLVDTGRGWLTAEYRMLPHATITRNARETRPRGRTQEIQRLVGRVLRAMINPNLLGERTVLVDCDVLQADGGTRVASITCACVAMSDRSTFVEIKGTAEGQPFSWTQLDDLLDLAAQGISELFQLQRASLGH